MNGWKLTTIGKEAELRTGKPFKSSEYTESADDIRLLRGDNIVQGTLRWDNVKRWPKKRLDEVEEYLLEEGDVILAMDRPWIEAGLKQACISLSDLPCLQVQRTARLRGGKSLHTSFLRYIIAGKPFTEYVKLVNTGSNVPHISGKQIQDFKIWIPLVDEQRKIANVLRALDQKIELNNKINAELEAMAKLIYDYWFVQFDFPDENGKPYKSSGGKMVYNEELKREIPEGWEAATVDSLLEKEKLPKKILSSDYQNSGEVPIIDQSQDYICGFTDDLDAQIDATEVPRIVFGDHTRALKFVNFHFARGADGTQVLLSKEKRMPQHCFFYTLSKIDLSNYGYARHYKFLKEAPVIIPEQSVANKFEKIAKASHEKIRHGIFENQELASLRDWLLPMLMNGQVKVGEGKEVLKAAEDGVGYGKMK